MIGIGLRAREPKLWERGFIRSRFFIRNLVVEPPPSPWCFADVAEPPTPPTITGDAGRRVSSRRRRHHSRHEPPLLRTLPGRDPQGQSRLHALRPRLLQPRAPAGRLQRPLLVPRERQAQHACRSGEDEPQEAFSVSSADTEPSQGRSDAHIRSAIPPLDGRRCAVSVRLPRLVTRGSMEHEAWSV